MILLLIRKNLISLASKVRDKTPIRYLDREGIL